MNRRELVAAIAAHTDQDPKVVDKTLRGFVDVVSATIKKGDPVVMTGFAKWAKVKRAARTARNPRTGEPVKVKASQKVRITPLKGLKDVASGAAPAPKLTKPTAKKATAKKATTKKAAAKKATTTTARGRAAAAEATTGTAVKRASTRKAAAKATTKKAATRSTAKKATTKKAAGRASATKATGTKRTARRSTAGA